MERKDSTNAVIFLLIALPAILAILADAYLITRLGKDIPGIVAASLSAFATVAALAYVFTEYRKKSAPFYRAFLLLFAAAEVAVVVRHALEAEPRLIPVVLFSIAATLLVALTFGKDIGKVCSFVFCGVTFAANLAELLLGVLFPPLGADVIIEVILSVSGIVLSLLLAIMIFAKYTDKAARHSK